MADNYPSSQVLQLAEVNWVSGEFSEIINFGMAEAVECALKNIAKQADMDARYNGDFTIHLNPVDDDVNKPDFITVENGQDNIMLHFNIVEALESQIKLCLEDGDSFTYDERSIIKSELIDLSAKINKLVDIL